MKSMKKVTLLVPPEVYAFYEKVGQMAGDLPVERVMADSLLKLAGELSLEMLHKRGKDAPGGSQLR